MRADDWAVARDSEEDEAIWRPVFSEWLKTGNKPRNISRKLERIGCRTADMPYGEMVNPQRSTFNVEAAARG